MSSSPTAGAAPASTLELARALPKVELHCHVEGTIRPSTVVDLARANGVALPTEDPTELFRFGSLDEFLAVFWLVQSVVGSRGDWARIGRESVLDAAAAGRVYAEVFFTPAAHLAAGQSLADVVAGLAEGVAAADAETGATTRLIAGMDRAHGGDAALALVTELGELRRRGAPGSELVIGVGMDSTELGTDHTRFVPAYQLAGRLGLRRTGHQGEDNGPEAIAWSVEHLGLERVDHGLSAVQDPALVARLAEARIPLTLCPSSNIVIANRVASLEEHPYPVLRAAGVIATINTDDPAMTGTSLDREYDDCARAFGYSMADVVDLAVESVDATWLDAGDAAALRTRIRTEGDALLAGAGAGAGAGEGSVG